MANINKLESIKFAIEYAESIINTLREPLIELDGDLRVISASRSFYRVFKVTPKITENKFIYDLGNRQWDIPALRHLLEEILPNNESFDGFEVEHYFPKIGKRVMILNARRVPPPPIKPKRILLAIEDITERKTIERKLWKDREHMEELIRKRTIAISKTNKALQAEISKHKHTEDKLRTSELRYRRLFETARDGILLVNADSGEIVDVNPYLTELLGYSQEEFRGKKLWQLGFLKDIAKSKADFAELRTKGYIRYENLPLQAKEGHPIDVEFLGNIYKMNHGNVIQCNIRDITERRRTEELQKKALENLKRIDGMKSDFISTVSHELRTPLAITREGVSQVLDRIQGRINEQQEEILVTARNNIDRLARIIENLLNISTIEGGKTGLKIALFDLMDLVKRVALSFEHKIKEKGLELRLSLPQDKVLVYADDDKIIQVLSNLLDNAVKFTPQGFIEISAQEKEDRVECAVNDSGIGISREDLPHVFSKFQKFAEISGRSEKGTGLGLSITKGIIELHNGKIVAQSKLGKGTKFTFSLPKYSYKKLQIKYINYAINEANKSGGKISVEMFSIAKYAQLKKKYPPEKIRSLLKGMENVLNKNLFRKGDVAYKDTGEIMVILMNCDKGSAIKVARRLEQAVRNYLASQGLGDKIRLRLGSATYPDEAESEEELIHKARRYSSHKVQEAS